jgi:guanylate kinase
MSAEGTGRLVILSGPSCVGKSPLAKALGRFHPDLSAKLHPIVLSNSRSPRPGERDGKDYHFRSRAQIETLRDRERYVVMDVRGDLQALDLEDLATLLQRGDAFFEGNPFIGRTLQTHPKLQDVNRLSMSTIHNFRSYLDVQPARASAPSGSAPRVPREALLFDVT